MSTNPVVIEGLVGPDGTLEVSSKVPLPAGRAQLTVVPLPVLPKDGPFFQRMQAIWDAQKAHGHVPRSAEEVEAERRAVRDEWEERIQEIEKTQAEGSAARGPGGQGG
jgi:hypothetical protein